MRMLFCIACFLLACGSKTQAPPDAPPPPAPAPKPLRVVRVLVAPFVDIGGPKTSTSYFSAGLTVFATARLEELSLDADAAKEAEAAGFRLETIVGQHVLSDDIAASWRQPGQLVDKQAAYETAKKHGATHVLTGHYGGRVEDWQLGVELYEVGPDRLEEIASAGWRGKIFAWSKDTPKPERPGVQLLTVTRTFGTLAANILANNGIALPERHRQALMTPQTPDIMSFINLARAYQALYTGDPPSPSGYGGSSEDDEKKMKKALEFARNAVNIWPDYQIARRFYAWLLWKTGSADKARLHFQEALKRDPRDVRTLVSLGRIELDAGQAEAARQAFEAASKLRPGDPAVHYWLGAALAKLGHVDEAIRGYELSRKLDPSNLSTRRALAGLYAGQKRYLEASGELQVIVEADPKDMEAVLLLAACQRAAGNLPAALAAYDLGLSRQPEDPKLSKLRAYVEKGESVKLAGTIREAESARDKMEHARAEFQDAVNDGSWELANLKKEPACAAGHAGSDALLADDARASYDAAAGRLEKLVAGIESAFKDGGSASLTPDEIASAEGMLLYAGKAKRDRREMDAADRGTFRPLLERAGCETDPRKIDPASIDEIRKRNHARLVDLPEPPRRDASGISPVVPPDAVDNVKWYVENRTAREVVIVLDGKALEPSVPPLASGAKPPQFTAESRDHVICHVPKGEEPACRPPNVRHVSLVSEGTTYVIQ